LSASDKKDAARGVVRASRGERSLVLDVRLHNVSQLAGLAKKQDLQYFLETICSVDYIHRPELAPTQEVLDAYKKTGVGWASYEKRFLDLMARREPHRSRAARRCLLCSEDKAHHCHRRLVAEYLRSA
jgi:uncharacterized protein (DUF488 family)